MLATAGTIHGSLFQNTSRRHANGVQIHLQIGKGLVEQVETGQLDTPDTEQLLCRYLEPMLAANVDQIVLGCTHYPLLMPLIQRLVGQQAKIIDPALAVARQVERILTSQALLQTQPSVGNGNLPQHLFFTSGQSRTFELATDTGNLSILFESVTLPA